MSLNENVVEGTLKPDGTLELDSKPNLPPGRVKVTVQAEDWWSYLQRCRAELEAAGTRFRSGNDIDAFLDEVRGESERVDGIYWEQNWARHHTESSS
jgi:hypothetical protein